MRNWLLSVLCTALLFILPVMSDTTNATRICRSLDIRNDASSFRKLQGCRVIEGFLHILLFDNNTDAHHTNLSFPELREITGYLLLFRVNGLRTLSQLFPNLAVIRGQQLLYNYGLVLYEVNHLQEIGLYSLTDIERGAVCIAKNPNLCYVNTIDWSRITKGDKDINYLDKNKAENECPLCPGDEKDTSALNCPMREYSDTKGLSSGKHLCWNLNHCQKICPDKCKGNSCTQNGTCCSDLCLGGCSAHDVTNCHVCRYARTVTGSFESHVFCSTKCSPDHLLYLNTRCVTEDECRKIVKPQELYDDIQEKYPFKPFNGSCVLHCPPNYIQENKDGRLECKKCDGSCPKKCPSIIVDSLNKVKRLQGCTVIEGNIEIQMRGGRNVVKELHEYLSQIEVIKGYLKVARSFPLVSLDFLSKLRVIEGETLESGKYSLVVLDNENLKELWTWPENFTKAPLEIKKGKLFFHYNPKLCLYKIEKLKKVAKLENFTELEVAPNSNGEKVPCNVTQLNVTFTQMKSEFAVISWKKFEMTDERALLGYVVYWMETDKENLTVYDARDACGGDGWHTSDVPNIHDIDVIDQPLTHLKPYTRYAYYVETYTIASEKNGAQSPIQYFRTKPGKPSVPKNLDVQSNASDTLIVKWEPPDKPNGNLTFYIVSGKWEKDDRKFLEQRDYCKEPPDLMLNAKVSPKPAVKEPEKTDTCECGPNNKTPEQTIAVAGKDAESNINFEDELHNLVFIKRNDKEDDRHKREIPIAALSKNELEEREKDRYPDSSTLRVISSSATKNDENKNGGSFRYEVREIKKVLKNLRHFTEYQIKVQACREIEANANETEIDACSTESIISERTKPKSGADDIKTLQVSPLQANQSKGMVRVSWEEPNEPNGLILTYHIEYKHLDVENVKPTTVCITRKQYHESNQSYILKNLLSGNYSVQVTPVSLSGKGGNSPVKNFYIEPERNSSVLEIIFGALGGMLLVVVFGIAAFLYLKKKYIPSVPNMKLIASVNPEYVSTCAYVPDDWEVPRKKIELLHELGQGSFGMVYEGIARDVVKGKPEVRCAVKTVNEHATDRERIEFLNEASVMKAFDTTHVVRLLGVVSQDHPTLVVMELMSFGDLKSYLRSHRPEENNFNPAMTPPSLKRILQMAIEIADGMAYLTAKKFVHRDLAARNCMVAEDLTVKIGDFGMTRDIYETDYYRKGTKGLLPVRWMAPESLKDGVFTSASDVWSYGVVLWEMATLASQPYQGLSNDQVLRYVIDGGVMERPENCPDKLYDLMRLTWQHKPSTRPSFLELEQMLLPDASSDFSRVSFYHSRDGQEALAAAIAGGVPSEEAEATTPLRAAQEDDFSLDGCSDLETGTEVRGRVITFPQYRTATYHDVPPGPSLPTANGYVQSRQGNDITDVNVRTTKC